MSGPEGTPNGGDRLAEIEALARSRDDWVYHDDVLALVEIAKAARGVMYAEFENADEVLVPKDDFDALRSALARLADGGGAK